MRIYMDNAASAPMTPEIFEAMKPYFMEYYGNPSSVHSFGREARKAMDGAREIVAKAIGAEPREIFFTGGGTEADNWAIFGTAYQSKRGKHIITSAVEHHAVLHSCERLSREGFEITYLPVDEYGRVSANDVEAAIRQDTALVTIMAANNEVGTIQPIAQIGHICREKGVVFHTDAVQALGPLDINVQEMKIDLLSLSAHKLHGPKGVGALYIRRGTRIKNLLEGGAHESGRRAGTENVPGIVGLGEAVRLAALNRQEDNAKLLAMRNRLMEGIRERISDVKLNGHPTERLPGNVNFSILHIEGEGLLLGLDLQGVAASTGSACTSGSLDPSHVLLAMGLDHATAHGSLRISLSSQNTMEEVERVLEILPGVVERLRAISPLFAIQEGGKEYV